MKADEKEQLWLKYRKQPSAELREQLILEYAQLVKIVAGRLGMYLGGNVEFDDLVSYGIFGLIDAIDKFDIDKEVKFETYASLRIRGAILDQIRKMDWIPRTIRQRQRQMDDVIKDLESQNGRTPNDEEVAEKLGISKDEYNDWQNQMKVTNLVSLNEFVEQGPEPVMDARNNIHFAEPEKAYEKEGLKEALKQSLELLTEKEKQVILFYYYEEMTLKEISLVLEVSESRVSQLHSKALAKMKTTMGDYIDLLYD